MCSAPSSVCHLAFVACSGISSTATSHRRCPYSPPTPLPPPATDATLTVHRSVLSHPAHRRARPATHHQPGPHRIYHPAGGEWIKHPIRNIAKAYVPSIESAALHQPPLAGAPHPSLAPARKNLIRTKIWGNLLDVSKFSAPEGLLEWIIDRIDPKLGEFRNPRNNTNILFTPEMVEKVLGLPHGTRPVVVISKHEESPHREFYKTDYDHGRRAPIHYAATILEKEADLDDETFFRTFFLVALATHLTPGTGNMVPLEYLGSLEVASEVCEYAWGDQILKDVMTEIDTFQKKKKKALLDGAFKKIWVGSCLPLVAIIYMDHLDFPESSISTHHINYSLPRASHVTDEDFKFVMLHDKSRLTLNAHIYGARPFRAPESTPYAIQLSNYDDQPATQPYIQQTENNSTNHPPQTEENQDMHHEAPKFPIKHLEELPAFLLPIIERHKAKWAQDISKATSRLTKLHAKRMDEFAQDVLATTKDYAPDPTNYSSPHRAKLSVLEDKFVATNCLREFNNAYQDGSLKSKDLVTNFVTLAAHAKAFTKLDFMKFTCFNPPDCPQQKTHFDCGIFTMLFMKQWDGKNMANFSKDTYDHRAIITELIITSQLNNQDPTWVLKTN
ncbi:hypothetical protein D1007_34755 [Hordeum vulgare]|nr:hypothetical protein D1007_34755 [Hordeum vulgare]